MIGLLSSQPIYYSHSIKYMLYHALPLSENNGSTRTKQNLGFQSSTIIDNFLIL